jgi:hypothetical protein
MANQEKSVRDRQLAVLAQGAVLLTVPPECREHVTAGDCVRMFEFSASAGYEGPAMQAYVVAESKELTAQRQTDLNPQDILKKLLKIADSSDTPAKVKVEALRLIGQHQGMNVSSHPQLSTNSQGFNVESLFKDKKNLSHPAMPAGEPTGATAGSAGGEQGSQESRCAPVWEVSPEVL